MTSGNESASGSGCKASASHSHRRNTHAIALSKRRRICTPRRRECGIFVAMECRDR
mgnify:CR=1 FL=1